MPQSRPPRGLIEFHRDEFIPIAMDQELQSGLSDLTARMTRYKLAIIERRRPWPERTATYLIVGNANRTTDIALSDEFLRDLPSTREYQTAVDEYASALENRIRCGSPNLFYCRSDVVIRVEIRWPIQSAVVGSSFRVHMLANVSDPRNGTIAKFAVAMGGWSETTTFDEVRSTVNRIRTVIDRGLVTFYKPEGHPIQYQNIESEVTARSSVRSQAEIERFIAGKAYWMAFRVPAVPGETWIVDPWDAEYLGVSPKELGQAAFVLRARGLLELDVTLAFARPADKLLTAAWPAAMDLIGRAEELPKLTLSTLPKKEQLIDDVRTALERSSDLAILVLDLDHFKEVNDTMGGHLAGDACLERIVEIVGAVLAQKGTLYRWGGDEFAIALPDFSTEEAQATAERIRREIQRTKPGGDIAVTASIGVCAGDRADGNSAEALLDAADKAMYASKQGGKNRVTCWPFESRDASGLAEK
jgi:diguanylate cyclase (GGDEF)-like protein